MDGLSKHLGREALDALYSEYDEDFLASGVCPACEGLGQVSDRYREIELLGEGAMKQVFKSYDEKAKREVALARLKPQLGASYFDSFIHEAWLTSSLSHPNIIKVYDVDVDQDGRPYFTMELKANRDFRHLWQQQLDLYERLNAFMTLCAAIEYAHSQGVVHLDLKPENIQCDEFGEILVCDWGLGKVSENISEHLEESSTLTMIGEVKGSLGYLSPEQIDHSAEKGKSSDIFSLGCILHFLMTGEPPFIGDKKTVLEETLAARVIPPHEKYPERAIPSSISAIILKCLQTEVSDRYLSVSSLHEDVLLYLKGYSPLAEKPSILKVVRNFVVRHRLKFIWGSVATVLSLMVGLFIQFERRLHRSESESLNSEINELLVETEAFNSLMDSSMQALFGKLVDRAHQLSKAMYDCSDEEFIRYHEQALVLLNKAQPYAPDHGGLNLLKVRLLFMMMDLQAVGECNNTIGDENFARLLNYAAQFPDYQWSEKEGPSLDQVIRLVRVIRSNGNSRDQRMLEELVRYYIIRSGDHDFTRLYVELMEYYNRESPSFRADYDVESGELRLISEKGLFVGSAELMKYLDLNCLRLERVQHIDLSRLSGARVRELDLRKLRHCHLKQPCRINGLEIVHLPKDPQLREKLRRYLESSAGEIEFRED